MSTLLSFPVTAAQQQRDLLLGALVGLARSTVNEPKTEDTDRETPGRPQLRQLHHALRQHGQLRPCPAVERAGRSPHPEARTSGSTFRAGTAPQHPADRRRNSERPICPRRGLGCNPAVPHRFARPRAMPRVTFWGNSR